MSHSPQSLVEIDARTTELVCKFPPNMRLHEGRHGIFYIRKGKVTKLISPSGASKVLHDIIQHLQNDADDLLKASGNYWQLQLEVACESAIDNVVTQLVIALDANNFRIRLQGRQLCTVQPRYAN